MDFDRFLEYCGLIKGCVEFWVSIHASISKLSDGGGLVSRIFVVPVSIVSASEAPSRVTVKATDMVKHGARYAAGSNMKLVY